MIKVEEITTTGNIQDDINAFITKPNIEVKDIKYSVVVFNDAIYSSALIIYKEGL